MIKYLGSKRTLLPTLVGLLDVIPELESVADVFSGTSRVGHALKAAGYRVEANDHNAYAHCIARCYVEADLETVEADATRLIAEFNDLPGEPGYFTEVFCERSRFFQPHNGARVDAIREAIARKSLDPVLEAVMLTSLMEAADRVDGRAAHFGARVDEAASDDARVLREVGRVQPLQHLERRLAHVLVRVVGPRDDHGDSIREHVRL